MDAPQRPAHLWRPALGLQPMQEYDRPIQADLMNKTLPRLDLSMKRPVGTTHGSLGLALDPYQRQSRPRRGRPSPCASTDTSASAGSPVVAGRPSSAPRS